MRVTFARSTDSVDMPSVEHRSIRVVTRRRVWMLGVSWAQRPARPPYQTHVYWMADQREWRAACTCGWIGSQFKPKRMSEAEANRHITAKHV